ADRPRRPRGSRPGWRRTTSAAAAMPGYALRPGTACAAPRGVAQKPPAPRSARTGAARAAPPRPPAGAAYRGSGRRGQPPWGFSLIGSATIGRVGGASGVRQHRLQAILLALPEFRIADAERLGIEGECGGSGLLLRLVVPQRLQGRLLQDQDRDE